MLILEVLILPVFVQFIKVDRFFLFVLVAKDVNFHLLSVQFFLLQIVIDLHLVVFQGFHFRLSQQLLKLVIDFPKGSKLRIVLVAHSVPDLSLLAFFFVFLSFGILGLPLFLFLLDLLLGLSGFLELLALLVLEGLLPCDIVGLFFV